MAIFNSYVKLPEGTWLRSDQDTCLDSSFVYLDEQENDRK